MPKQETSPALQKMEDLTGGGEDVVAARSGYITSGILAILLVGTLFINKDMNKLR